MDELNLEPLEPLEPLETAEQKENKEPQVVAPIPKRWNYQRWILPGGIVLAVLFVIGIYLMVAPAPDKLIAQVFRFDITLIPDTARVTMSISNKQEKQTVIEQLYPVFFGKENSGIDARSIEGSTIEGESLPLTLKPGETRTLKINFSIEKKNLDQYADKLKDSIHMVVLETGPLPGQLEGFLGLGWRVVDAEGNNYTNIVRLAYYVLTPTPPGFADATMLARSWTLSEDPFELCTREGIKKEGE